MRRRAHDVPGTKCVSCHQRCYYLQAPDRRPRPSVVSSHWELRCLLPQPGADPRPDLSPSGGFLWSDVFEHCNPPRGNSTSSRPLGLNLL